MERILQEAAVTGILNVNAKNLSSLPPLPPNLRILHCGYNKLSELPELPKGLEELNCASNKIRDLPVLPNTLVSLRCDSNPITKLPDLPSGLQTLSCSYTKLTTLPVLPTSLKHLSLSGNNFTGKLKSLVDKWDNETTNMLRHARNMNNIAAKIRFMENESILLLQKFIRQVNTLQELKEELIKYKYNPDRIVANMKRNLINMNAPMSEENYNKYYEKRGEEWTEGVGRGPKQGGKTQKRKSKRRLNKTSKKH